MENKTLTDELKELKEEIVKDINKTFTPEKENYFEFTRDELLILRTVATFPPKYISREDYEKAEEVIRDAVVRAKAKSLVTTPLYAGERTSDERITKSAGYIPLAKQIDILIEAGHTLEQARDGMYDFQDENDIDLTRHPDPTRHPSYDISDAFEDAKKYEGRVAEILEKAKPDEVEDVPKTAPESVEKTPSEN